MNVARDVAAFFHSTQVSTRSANHSTRRRYLIGGPLISVDTLNAWKLSIADESLIAN